MRRAIIAASLCACTPTEAHPPLLLQDDRPFGTLAVFEPGPGGPDEADGASLRVLGAAPLVLPERPTIALLYADTATALQWAPGAYPHDDRAGGPIRCPDRIVAHDDPDDRWRTIDAPAGLARGRFGSADDPCVSGAACTVACPILGATVMACDPACTPEAPRAPIAPARPTLWCPTGTVALPIAPEAEPVVACRAPRRSSCGAGDRLDVDGGCSPLASACAERWPDPPPGVDPAALRWVTAAPAPGGDGRGPGAPITLSAAIAEPGTTLLLSAETHALPDGASLAGVSLYGACASRTRVTIGTAELTGTATIAELTFDGGVLRMNGVARVAGVAMIGRAPGAEVSIDGAARFERSIVRAAKVFVRGQLAADRSELDTLHLFTPGSARVTRSVITEGGIDAAAAGARIELDQVWITAGPGDRLHVRGAATGSASRVLIEGGRAGVKVVDGASLVLSQAQLEGSTGNGAEASSGGVLEAEDLVVIDAGEQGIAFESAASGTVRRAAVTHRAAPGAHVAAVSIGADATVTLEDLWLARYDSGIETEDAGFTLRRARIHDAPIDGVAVEPREHLRQPVVVDASDVWISGSTFAGVRLQPYLAMYPLSARLERIRVTDGTGTGLFVFEGEVDVAVTDLEVQRLGATVSTANECTKSLCLGNGVLLNTGTLTVRATFERFLLTGLGAVGMDASSGVDLVAREGLISAPIGLSYDPEEDWRSRITGVRIDAPLPVRVPRR